MVTGSFDTAGSTTSGQVGCMSGDPSTFDEAMKDDASGWSASMMEEQKSLEEHNVFDWVDVPSDTNVQLLPSRFLYRRKYNKDGKLSRLKSRVVVQGLYEKETGADRAAPVATQESVRLVIAHAAKNRLFLKMVDIKTAYLQARMKEDDPSVFVIPPVGFKCTEVQSKKVWKLEAWLYSLRLAPRGWHQTIDPYLISRGFVASTVDPCLYNKNNGEVLLLLYVDDILIAGKSKRDVEGVIGLLKDKFDTVDLGDAKFLLGIGIKRDMNAGTIKLSQEAFANTI